MPAYQVTVTDGVVDGVAVTADLTVVIEGLGPLVSVYGDTKADTTDGTDFTLTGVALGAAATNTRVLVGVLTRKADPAATVSSVSVTSNGGTAISCTMIGAAGTNTGTEIEWWITNTAILATSTTAEITIINSDIVNRLVASVWRVQNYQGFEADSYIDTVLSTRTLNVSLPIAAGSSVFAMVTGLATTATGYAWTGLTERYENMNVESNQHASSASLDFATAVTNLAVSAVQSGSASAPTYNCLSVLKLLSQV